jgi:medium-chain acyl-[acyl-carrier-protein] hydrolase
VTLAETWIRVPLAGSGTPVFCFPYAGGGAGAFRSLRSPSPEGLRILPVRLPGREDRISQPAACRMADLTEPLADAVTEVADGPFAFFGHSVGALLAFELARELRRRGAAGPAHLFVAACQPPHALPPTRLHDLPREELVEALLQLGGTSDVVLAQPELLRLLEPALRADLALYELYEHEPEPPLACPITAVGGLRDERVSQHELAQWSRHTDGPFELRIVRGGHFFVEAARDELLELLAERLEPAQARA